jgi:predicted nucleic acid-binding protein
MYIRQGKLSSEKAMEFMNEAEILMQGEEYQVDSGRIIKLIDSSKCSAYDCEFVALAQNLDVPLITSDKQIINEFPETAISIESYGESA